MLLTAWRMEGKKYFSRHCKWYSDSFVKATFGEILPKSPLLPNSPFLPNLPAFQDPSSWVNLLAIIISSTTSAKFRQNRDFRQIRCFRQICKHFRALVAGLIYSLLSFRQQPWRNFARIAIFATGCSSGHIW